MNELKYEFSSGDTFPPSETSCLFDAGIDVTDSSEEFSDLHCHRIAVYGDTSESAEQLRDFILASLNGSLGSLDSAFKAGRKSAFSQVKELME